MRTMSKTFKQLLNEDLDVIFNEDEFGEIHVVDGKKLLVYVIDEDSDEFNASSSKIENVAQGIYEKLVTLYVKESDYSEPDIGYSLELNGKKYTVTNTSVSAGMLKIKLLTYES